MDDELTYQKHLVADLAGQANALRKANLRLRAALAPFAAMVHHDGIDAPHPEEKWVPLLNAAKESPRGGPVTMPCRDGRGGPYRPGRHDTLLLRSPSR